MIIAKHYLVRGVVQGVGFRNFAAKVAKLNNLTGSVRNRQDGGLEISIEGKERAVELFEGLIHRGPPLARVDEMRVEPMGEVRNFREFRILI